MKEIVFISGKGGTGKTSLTAAVASLAARNAVSVFADCDVDAADLHLIFDPKIRTRDDFFSGHVAKIAAHADISAEKGKACVALCRFGAIGWSETDGLIIDEYACEGCGVCVKFCPEHNITFPKRYCGAWFVSYTRFGPFVHAALETRAENSGKLVTTVRKEAKKIALEINADYLIVDGSPGTGCPVIASITGADAVVVVSEPTLSGRHDLERVSSLARHFTVPIYVCVNKYDINGDISRSIQDWCERNDIPFLGMIPYDPSVTAAQIQGKTMIEYTTNKTTDAIREIFTQITRRLL